MDDQSRKDNLIMPSDGAPSLADENRDFYHKLTITGIPMVIQQVIGNPEPGRYNHGG